MLTKWARIGWIVIVLPIFWAFYRLEEVTPWFSTVGYFLFGLAVLIWFRLMEEEKEEKK
ncbi:hypothetical protein [Ammoniphilus sp. YIM 78166]|uniref:hypothetical protein n=1 Tax=Ammoniphilus sp. YIM 78166 TaxID=1644106 RepID=UPI0014301B3C|nr:hypothetical protein [Ammoniphilus sp. YIM 78166]